MKLLRKKIQQKNPKQKNPKKRNNILRVLAAVVIVFVMVIGIRQTSYASWVEDEDGIHYKDEEGNYVTGFQIIEEETYYFDGDGNLLKGKIYVEDQDAYYYGDEDGKLVVGVVEDGTHFFITDETGKLKTGFVEYNGKSYYFNSKVELVTGWFKYGEDWYYADASGSIMTGFITLDGYRYYLDESGVRVSDTVMEIDGVTYVFNKDGSVDENGTALYPLLVYVNEKRREYGLDAFSINKKVQSCAVQRAADLVNGYGVSKETSIETMLNNRGVSSSGGYEFSYGGTEGYNMERLFADLERDERFIAVLKDADVTDAGFGVFSQEECQYFDFIFIQK